MSTISTSRIARGFGFALRGIGTLVKTQANARFHALATLGVVAAGCVKGFDASAWAILFLAIGLVWVAEGLNTAIEFLADATVPEYHPLIEKAKDVAAGAVLIAAIVAIAVGYALFIA